VIIAEGLQRVRPGVKADPKPIERDVLQTLPTEKPTDEKPVAEEAESAKSTPDASQPPTKK
jgi:hypothetical protein